MRYFKYGNGTKTEKEIMYEQYRKLNAKEKRLLRRRKWSVRFFTGLVTIASFGVFVGGIWLVGYIEEPKRLVWMILCILLKIAVVGCTLILSLMVHLLLSLFFKKKIDVEKKAIEKELLSKACSHLREYYELQEPCLVTKCYASSDQNFVNHDVCLFVVGDELRITTNLKHGFFHGDKDLGCYGLNREEWSLSQIQTDHYLATELKADGIEFLLGAKAFKFINNHFVNTL